EIEKRLISGTLDIGISYLPARQPGLHGVLLYEDELQLVIPATHPLKDFRKVSIRQAAELPMLMLGEEFQMRQIWQAQLASQGRRPQVQAEMNNMAGILDSLSHTSLATILPGRAKEAEQAQQGLLWKPLSEPRVPLKVGLVFRDAQRQQASIELLRGLLEEETDLRGPAASPLDALG
ncbi:MAG TPA: LysR family transcriptional regulator, partial [Pseudomonas sp.]|nr:LysR family transcriptional regulator [Pseudomonas sp.]